MRTCMYVCMHVCVDVYVCMYACMHACMHACMCVPLSLHHAHRLHHVRESLRHAARRLEEKKRRALLDTLDNLLVLVGRPADACIGFSALGLLGGRVRVRVWVGVGLGLGLGLGCGVRIGLGWGSDYFH